MQYVTRLLAIVLLAGSVVGCSDSDSGPQPVGEPRFGADGRRFQDMSNGQTRIDGAGRAGGLYPNK